MAPAIPRLFHWIWFGEKPLPEQHGAWIEGWLELHPGWKHVLWTDENRPTLGNEAQFLAARSFAQKADIARYELVYRYGGVYVDTDTECLRSIEPLLDGVEAFAGEHRAGTVQNHPFGAISGHPWLAEVIARLPRAMEAAGGGHHGTGPRFLTRVTHGRRDVTVFPAPVFFHQPPRFQRDVPPGAYALHHATRSWADALEALDQPNAPDSEGDQPSRKVAELIRLDVDSVIPPEAPFVLVGDGYPADLFRGRTVVPFPERTEKWTDYPADDEEVVASFSRASARGARFVVVPRPMAYWLEIYPGFSNYLRTHASVRVDNDRTLIVELGDE